MTIAHYFHDQLQATFTGSKINITCNTAILKTKDLGGMGNFVRGERS